MSSYRIGQILTSKEDVVVEMGLSGEKVTIPKGNKIMIGADGFAHHLKDGCIQRMPDDAIIGGYDTEGIAEVIYMCLNRELNIQEDILDGWGIDKEQFVSEIEWALEEYVGM